MQGFLKIIPLANSTDMIDDSILGLPFLAGIVALTTLYIIWYSRVHPLVSP